ncbi:aspartic protease [Lithospermum erythrorhizon]|uniref:Aspartic protease n=1 Tax=Lithospermum erythrorhizon TaxID=34254 RepID=A0AAV3RZC1_LITER
MVSKFCPILFIISLCFCNTLATRSRNNIKNLNSSASGIKFPDHSSYNSGSSSPSTDCGFGEEDVVMNIPSSVKLPLKHRSFDQETNPKDHFLESTTRDLLRIQTLHRRITEKKNQNPISRNKQNHQNSAPAPLSPASSPPVFSGQLMATLASGVSLGSGEYFMDVFIGTPPKHYSLILDTGSDLNWIQCEPCYDCFTQNGPYYDPEGSISFKNISCHDPRCRLVSSPDPPQLCKEDSQSCPYYYWYGDSSNTTGDFALETFTVNLTSVSGKSEFKKVENVMFGCGHWNRGLFHGAAGLLGLGRGPLSFASQLQTLYGHSFSYCLVDRNSNMSVSSKLIFGENKEVLNNPLLNFTTLVSGKENPVDTFYYIQIKSIIVGGETLNISGDTWDVSPEGSGGTIIDSGTTLSYFADPANKTIREAFVSKIKGYPIVDDYSPLYPCYNVSGVENVELPSFGIEFNDGAIWNFPVENYFIRLEPEEVVCLAILGTPHSALSIIGNYQQQNFHILYDTKNSRLGFAPTKCD